MEWRSIVEDGPEILDPGTTYTPGALWRSVIQVDERRLFAALDHGHAGRRVLPLYWIENGRCACGGQQGCKPAKHPYSPYVPNGKDNATSDLNLIREWWTLAPKANIGFVVPDDMLIIDYDRYRDHDGGGAKLMAEIPPGGPSQKSGSGGSHVPVKPAPGRLVRSPHPSIDLLAGGKKYIVVEPSVNENGEYEWTTPIDAPVPNAPEWVYSTHGDGTPNEGGPAAHPDHRDRKIDDVDRSRADWHLGKSLKDAGYDAGTVLAVLEGGDKSLHRKDGYAHKTVTKLFGEAAPHAQPASPWAFRPAPGVLKDVLLGVEYILSPILPRGGVVIVQARPKLGKSETLTALAVHVALGLDMGSWTTGGCSARVALLAYEDGPRRLKRRMREILHGLKLGPDAIPEGVLLWPDGRPPEDWLDNDNDAERMLKALKDAGADCVIIDTFAYAHGAQEMDGSAMRPVLRRIRRLADSGLCVVLVHHTRKIGQHGDLGGMTDRTFGSVRIAGQADVILDMRREADVIVAEMVSKDDDPAAWDITRTPSGAPGRRAVRIEVGPGLPPDARRANRVAEALADAGEAGLSPTEAAAVLGVSDDTARRALKQLEADGRARREPGAGRKPDRFYAP